jgi:hypothetical protein
MQFVSSTPSVIRSIRQRVFLNTWLRAARKRDGLPLLADFRPEAFADELPDMMGLDVVGSGDGARFLITQNGSQLAAAYGNKSARPDHLHNSYLDDAIGPDRYARVLPSYRACLSHRRPTYSISTVQDSDGRDVSYERLLLPFGKADAVEQIVGSYKAISIDGGFKVRNLMGLRSGAPIAIVSAVIDRDFVPAARTARAGSDVIELD